MPYQNKRISVALSVTNCICYDQRVLKMAGIISELGCDVIIIGRNMGSCCESDSVAFSTKRFRMMFKTGFLFYKFFNIRLFFYLLFHNSNILVANDLDTLMPNFIVSRLKRIPLVYDSHEYFTGVPEIQKRPLIKWVWKSIEKFIFPHLKYCITVSDSIASLYESEYRIRPITVRNCPKRTFGVVPFNREDIAINPDHLLAVLQGTGINRDRGGEELIEAVFLTENVSLLVVGAGDMIDILKQRVLVLGLSELVNFIPKVPAEELLRYTMSADVGISLDKDTNLNYRFSLPNKLFDYIGAGIAVIAGDLPEVSKIISENNCGIVLGSVTTASVSEAFANLRDDRIKLAELKKNSARASENLNWEIESLKVKELYIKVLKEVRNRNNQQGGIQ